VPPVYHQPDWMSVARLGCALAETHGSSLTDDAMDAAAVGVDPSDRLWLRSLFEWPIKIKWHPTSSTLTDGQHRACGLVLSGAERVPVWPPGRWSWRPRSDGGLIGARHRPGECGRIARGGAGLSGRGSAGRSMRQSSQRWLPGGRARRSAIIPRAGRN
jgi:hypothetical protein